MTPINHARAGLQVLVLADTQDAARDLLDGYLDEFATNPPADVDRVIRAKGAERIGFRSGGRVDFLSRRSPHAIRGRAYDVVYLDDHRPILDPEFMARLAPVFAGTGDVRIGVIP